jgi:hypothetical protein
MCSCVIGYWKSWYLATEHVVFRVFLIYAYKVPASVDGIQLEGSRLDVSHWLFKKRGKQEIPESDFFTLPLTQKEMTVLAHTIVATSKLEKMDKADEALLGTISNRVFRWTEQHTAENETSVVFIGLRLTPQELIVLSKNLAGVRKSDQIETADKQILDGIFNRVVRWAERQGAWWDDGHKIITSLGQQID